MTEEWRATAWLPGYEVNRSGDVRNVSTGHLVRARQESGRACPAVTATLANGQARSAQLNMLLEETFGPGAAEAGGLPAPNMARALRARERIEQNRGKPRGRANGKRPCHDCGRPTNDYRCASCWEKLRGYASAEGRLEEGI